MADTAMEIDGPEYYLLPSVIVDPSATASGTSPRSPTPPRGAYLPTILERTEPLTPTIPQFPSQPATRSRKRGFEAAFAADYAHTYPTGHNTAAPVSPTPSSGMLTTIYQYARGVIASFLGYSISDGEKNILAVKTGNKRRAIVADLSPSKLTAKLPGAFPMAQEDIKTEVVPAVREKAGAVAHSTATSTNRKMPDIYSAAQKTASKTGQIPAVHRKDIISTKPDTDSVAQKSDNKTETVSAVQLETPPESRPTSSQENLKQDSPMAEQIPWLFQPSKPSKLATCTGKVVGRLPAPTFSDFPPPSKRWLETGKTVLPATLSKNARKDAEINSLIAKSKRALLPFPKLEQKVVREEVKRGRSTHGVTHPDSHATEVMEQDINKEQNKMRDEKRFRAEDDEKRAQWEAQKDVKAAKLKAEQEAMKAQQEAIEQLLQEEAAKQAELVEEEKKQEELRKALEEQARISDPEYIKKQQLIRPLDPEWNAKVDAEMAVKSRNHVVTKTVDGTDLTRQDFGTLLPQEGSEDDPNGWLNDEIVNGWMSSIVSRKLEQTGYVKSNKNVPAYAAMASAWYTNYKKPGGMQNIARWSQRKGIKGKKLLQCEKVFFPINTGAHWLLLIVSPKDRSIELLDSLNGSSKRWFSIAREWLEMELGEDYVAKEWKELHSQSSRQMNMNDCGVFACFNALAAAKGKNYEEVGGNMDDARRLMGAILLNNGFSGDYEL